MLIEEISLNITQETEEFQELANEVRHQSALNHEKASLERQFCDVSDEATASDEITRLQRLADEIREFTLNKKLYQLKQVIGVTLDEAKSFCETFSQPLPDCIFTALSEGIETLIKSLKLAQQSAEKLKFIENFDENSSEKQLRNWAINLEILAEELENCLPFITLEILESIEKNCETIVLKARRKGKDAKTKRESYRRRLRFAAGFVLNLVEMTRENALAEDEEVLQALQSLSQETLSSIYREDDEPWNPQDNNLSNDKNT